MQTEQDHLKSPATWEANLLVFTTFILVLIAGAAVAASGITTTMIIAQALIILPLVLWMAIRRFPLRTTLRLHPVDRRTAIRSALIGLACWPAVAGTSTLIEKGLELIGPGSQTPYPVGVAESAIYAFTLIILAPLTEEPLFRGFVLRAWLRRGTALGLVLSALLFAAFHFQLAALLPLVFLGIALGLLAWRSNSIYSSMIAHACYNTLGTLFLVIPWLRDFPEWPLVTAGAICLPIAIWLLWAFARRVPAPAEASVEPDRSSRIWTILSLLAILLITGAVAAGELFTRYSPGVTGP